MVTFELLTAVTLPHPRGRVFAFFADAGNLDLLTPPWLSFNILTPRPIQMRAGALIDYRLRLHGVPIRWRTRIAKWDPPFEFVDEQLRGPYSLWEHTHTFTEVDAGTRVEDRVRYRVPGGRLVHRLFVEPDLRKVFGYRVTALRRVFGLPDEAAPDVVIGAHTTRPA
jgi:ligand-binding SRPBCC domain-containing protein